MRTLISNIGTVVTGEQVGIDQEGLAATVRPLPAEQQQSGHRLSLPLIG